MPVAGKWKLNFQRQSLSVGDFVVLNLRTSIAHIHSLFSDRNGTGDNILNSCDVYCQRLKRNNISFYNWWIYLRVLCCENPFSAENFKISFLLQLQEPGDAASLKKSYFWIAATTQLYLGGKCPQSHFSPQHFPGQAAPPPPPWPPPAPPYQLHSCLSAWRGTGCCHGSLEARLALWRLLAGEACLSCTWEAWWGAWEVAEAPRGERWAPPWTAWCTAAGWSPPRPRGDTTSCRLGMGKILTRRTIMQPAITPSITWVLKNYQPEILFWQAGGAKLQETQVKVETNIKVLQEDGTNTMTWVFCHRG